MASLFPSSGPTRIYRHQDESYWHLNLTKEVGHSICTIRNLHDHLRLNCDCKNYSQTWCSALGLALYHLRITRNATSWAEHLAERAHRLAVDNSRLRRSELRLLFYAASSVRNVLHADLTFVCASKTSSSRTISGASRLRSERQL